MRSLLLVTLFANLDIIRTSPQFDDIVLDIGGLNEPFPDELPFEWSEEPDPLDVNSHELIENTNEPFDFYTDVVSYNGREDFFLDDSMPLAALESTCEPGANVPNEILRTRDTTSCPSTGEENIELPELFQDPENSWGRKIPPGKAPAENHDMTPLDALWNFVFSSEEDSDCPPAYPLYCCTDDSQRIGDLHRGVFPNDCVQGMYPTPGDASKWRTYVAYLLPVEKPCSLRYDLCCAQTKNFDSWICVKFGV
jgi:hypothetical protein